MCLRLVVHDNFCITFWSDWQVKDLRKMCVVVPRYLFSQRYACSARETRYAFPVASLPVHGASQTSNHHAPAERSVKTGKEKLHCEEVFLCILQL